MLNLVGIVADDVAAALERWQTYMATERRYAPGTQRNRTDTITTFLTFLNQHKGKPITLDDLGALVIGDFRAWLAARATQGLSNNTCAGNVSAVRTFFRWLDQNGLVHCAAVDMLQTPKRTKALPRTLSEQQVDQLLQANNVATSPAEAARDQLILVLLYATGLRASELLSLNIGDVRGKNDVMVTGKGSKQRLLPLLPIVQTAIEAYIPYHPDAEPSSPLLLGKRGKRESVNALDKRFRELRAALGLPEHLTPHAMRHSFATHLLAGGADLRTLQELLGHAALSSTQVYTDLETEQLLNTYRQAHPKGK